MLMEILLPLQNPNDTLVRTIDSILQQKRQDFGILLSDNYSTSGKSLIKKSFQKLSKAGLHVQLLRPPMKLKPVEHWNWIHFQSQATWIKPLWAGDWLEPNYTAIVLHEIESDPQCSYIYCPYHQEKEADTTIRRFSASEMQQKVLRSSMEFGPPSASAYRREAFLAMGGYRAALHLYADALFLGTLAARLGGTEITRPLVHLHSNEKPISRKEKRASVFGEKIIFLVALFYHAFTENAPLSRWVILRRMTLAVYQRISEKLNLSAL